MKNIYTIVLVLLLINCSVKENEIDSVDQLQNSTTSIEPQHPNTQHLFAKEDIKGIWTSGETENASFSIEEDSVLYVDSFEYVKYIFKNDTITYFDETGPYWQGRVIKADKDSLVITSELGTDRFWRFKD
jgi:hypothetical protein